MRTVQDIWTEIERLVDENIQHEDAMRKNHESIDRLVEELSVVDSHHEQVRAD